MKTWRCKTCDIPPQGGEQSLAAHLDEAHSGWVEVSVVAGGCTCLGLPPGSLDPSDAHRTDCPWWRAQAAERIKRVIDRG